MRTITFFGTLLALVGCGGPPAVETTPTDLEVERAEFTDLDRDDDDHLDVEELFGATAVYYDVLDLDQDGQLTDRELSDGLFAVWDVDRDGRLSERELERGAVSWFPAEVDASLRAWDESGDFEVDRAEFHHGMDRARVLARWDEDGDGLVTDLELTDAIFETWDVDDSRSIDALEYRFE